jgi:outer membrane receptor protein involved in Fe transport
MDVIVQLLTCSAQMASVPALAASPQEPADIVVTGERVPRRLRDTASSVLVISKDEIEGSSADRIDQLLASTPNVQEGSGEEGPAIRGQDSTGALRNLFAFLGGTRPRVTIQVDGRPISYYEFVNSSAPLWDVERVEIFRSPQTTTQGRNSIAGALFVETSDPTFNWQARGRLIAGNSTTRQASAAISGPLIGNQLAVRVTGDGRLSRMASDMADGISGADIDRDDYGSARVKLLFKPSAIPDLRMEASYAHLQAQSPQFEAVAAPFEQRRYPLPVQTNGIHRVNVDSITVRTTASVGSNLSSSLVLSGGHAKLRRFGLPGLGETSVSSQDRSIEALLDWTPPRSIRFTGGVHALRTQQRQFIDISRLNKIGVGEFRDRQLSLGFFGEATWKPSPEWTLIAGLRRQSDRQRRVGAVGSEATGFRLDYDERFRAWLPKVSLAYAWSDGLTTGLLFQKAYNPGGTSISLSRRAEDRFEAERLRNVEAFARASFGGGRGTFSANLFHNAIRQSQRQLTVPITLADGSTIYPVEFANAPRAQAYGLEAEITWRVGQRLSLRGGVGLLRTELTETLVSNDTSRGKNFQRAPKWSAAAAIDWRPWQSLRLSGNLRHHDGYFSDDANSANRRIRPATLVDVRAAYTVRQLTLFGYVRNLFDRFTLNYLFSPTFGTAVDPREVGVGVEARY